MADFRAALRFDRIFRVPAVQLDRRRDYQRCRGIQLGMVLM
jgi:hypothetical protein